jgi:putative two-component system response regulator
MDDASNTRHEQGSTVDENATRHARILIVDDEPTNVALLERLLTFAGFTNVVGTTVSADVIALCDTCEPDLVMLDLQMPEPDGYEVLEQLRSRIRGTPRLPVLMLTSDGTRAARQRALAEGASDFVHKPFDAPEMFLRIHNLVRTRMLECELLAQNAALEERVSARTKDLDDARIEVLERLAHAAEYRDDRTGDHARRVGDGAAEVAIELGLDAVTVERLRCAAPLHDIGKLAIPDSILLKPGRLTDDEFEHIKLHTTIGGEILGGSRSALLQMAAEIALTHHERWDGNGYPRALGGARIPIEGRIVAIVDAFDALTHSRPYKEAWPPERALAELRAMSGHQFDPDVVAAFVAVTLDAAEGELPRAA